METRLTLSLYLNQMPITLSAIIHGVQANWGTLSK